MQIIDSCYTGMAGNTTPVPCAPVRCAPVLGAADLDATQQMQDRSQRLSLADRLHRVTSLSMRFFNWYHHRRALARERRLLASFDDHMLRDIGLSRADAEQEISKGFWRD